MHEETIQQLDDAVSEVFSMMLNRDCTPGRCDVQSPRAVTTLQVLPREDSGCVSAEVHFSGSMRGSCSIYLAERSAAVITAELLGEESSMQGSLAEDATGELCNIIAGSWKSRQAEAGAACSISSPRVESGQTCAPGSSSSDAQGSVSRTYRFTDHCLRLDLTVR